MDLKFRKECHRDRDLKTNRGASSIFLAIAMVTDTAGILAAWGLLLRLQKCMQCYAIFHSSLLSLFLLLF